MSDGRLMRHVASYVLPIKTTRAGSAMNDLTPYLAWLSERVDLIVVDGSGPDVFAANHAAWATFGRHVEPDPTDRCSNGKVWGVRTGVRIADHDVVILADDDVRYDERSLREAIRAAGTADLVRPQNYFSTMPWHALWDTARTLVNRSIGADHPGTLIVRRGFFLAMGTYDGDVLFENLELVRTVRAAGGLVADRPDLYVRRVPPDARTFWGQRPRQAYDDLAAPARFAATLTALPAIAWGLGRRRWSLLGGGVAALFALAALGRVRHGGARVFPPYAIAFTPLWGLERACCEWVALGWWLRGGIPYAGMRIRRAAHRRSQLRRSIGVTARWSRGFHRTLGRSENGHTGTVRSRSAGL